MMRARALTEIPYSWVVVALCLAALVSFALFRWGLGVLFPFIQEDLDTSRAELGLIAGGLALGGGSTALLAGWLVDAMGPRRLLTAGAWSGCRGGSPVLPDSISGAGHAPRNPYGCGHSLSWGLPTSKPL